MLSVVACGIALYWPTASGQLEPDAVLSRTVLRVIQSVVWIGMAFFAFRRHVFASVWVCLMGCAAVVWVIVVLAIEGRLLFDMWALLMYSLPFTSSILGIPVIVVYRKEQAAKRA